MSLEIRIAIGPSGVAKAIYTDELVPDLQSLSDSGHQVQIDRASNVEPALFGVGWFADMAPSGGPVLAPSDTRQGALDSERAWLDRHLVELAHV